MSVEKVPYVCIECGSENIRPHGLGSFTRATCNDCDAQDFVPKRGLCGGCRVREAWEHRCFGASAGKWRMPEVVVTFPNGTRRFQRTYDAEQIVHLAPEGNHPREVPDSRARHQPLLLAW